MKTAETHKSTTSQSQIQAKQQPFFKKEGEGSFFSKSAEKTTPFFNKNIPFVKGEQGGIQPKLTIGKPNDKYEVEADAMADKVVQRLSDPKSNSPLEGSKGDVFNHSGQGAVQTKCATCEEKEKLQKKEDDEVSESDSEVQRKPIFESNAEQPEANVQTKPVAPFIQKKCATCEQEEKIQKKENLIQTQKVEFPIVPDGENEQENDTIEEVTPEQETATEEKKPETKYQSKGGPIQLPSLTREEEKEIQPIQTKKDSTDHVGSNTNSPLEQSLHSSKGKGSAMSKSTQQKMDGGFGTDFSSVRIHTNSDSIQMNKDLGAQAFTHGNDIYFNEGKYNPDSKSGQHLLAHELTHTVQQGATNDSIQRFVEPEKIVSPEATPEKPNDGAQVEGKSNNKIDNDERVQDQDDLSEEEKEEKKNPPRGEVRQERSEVYAEGVATPEVDRGAEAQGKIAEQKEQMDEQLSEEASAEEAQSETPENAEQSNMAQADIAAQRAQQAEQAAQSVEIPVEPQSFQHPNVTAPVDSAGEAIPRQANIDTQVRGLGYIGEMLRAKGYEMKQHAAEKEIHSYGLDATLEKQREDLALAKEGTKKIEDQNTERKEISEKSKLAHEESQQRQQFVAAEAPGLVQEADSGKEDSSALASDAQSKADQSRSEIPDDPDARADAEQQSGEMEQTAEGAQSMDDAITQTGERARQYIQDAEIAAQDNEKSQASIQETDSTIAQIDARAGEMNAMNESSNASIENAGPGPALIRQHSQRTAQSGDELIAASMVMEQELTALQDEYLSSMAALESKEDAERRVQEEQAQEQEQPQIGAEEQQLYTLASLPDEEQEQQISQMSEEEKTGLMAALDRMIATAPDNGTDETEGARTSVNLSGVNEAISGAQSTLIRAGMEGAAGEYGTMAADAMGVGQTESDPRAEQIQQIDQQRTQRVGGVLDIADQNMNYLSQEQQRILAERLVGESITDDIKNINILQMGRDMLIGMVNPAMALQGVVGGFEKTFTGVANIFNAEAWERDPLGNLLQIGADISTGLAMVFSSILGIAGMITALMIALTIFSWGTLAPFTGPVIAWMGTVMTYAGWGAIIAGLLSVYFNSLAYIKNLHDASTATTARELFGNTEQMKQNATDGFQGAMAVVEGIGAVKMGPSLSGGDFMTNVPRSPGAFARQTISGARDGLSAVAGLPGRAARGARRLLRGGRQGLVSFKNKIQGFFRRTRRADVDIDTPQSRQRNQQILDDNRSRSLDEMTPEQRRVDLQETSNHQPRPIDPDSPHYHSHDVEIESNGHTYRRRRDGRGWCRFSAQECGIGESELPDDVRAYLNENDQMLREHGALDDMPENIERAQREARRAMAEADIELDPHDAAFYTEVTPDGRIINQHLAGRTHPVTGVPFDQNGFPIFDSLDDVELPRNLVGPNVSDTVQMRHSTRRLKQKLDANPALRQNFTPEQLAAIDAGEVRIPDLTWHHHQDGITMQLVDRSIHDKTGHSGGRQATGGRS